MRIDRHDAMRHIIDRSLVGEASDREQQSLREHLRDCAACQQYAADGRRAIASLSGFSFSPDPALQAKILASLAAHAQQQNGARPGSRRIVQSCVAALLLTVAGSFAAWHIDGPLAAAFHLDPAGAQAGVLALWLLPSWGFALVFPIVLLFSHRSTRQKGSVQ